MDTAARIEKFLARFQQNAKVTVLRIILRRTRDPAVRKKACELAIKEVLVQIKFMGRF